MYCCVSDQRNAECRDYAFSPELADTKLEEEYRNAHLENVGEVVEAKNGVEYLRGGDGIVENESNGGAERP